MCQCISILLAYNCYYCDDNDGHTDQELENRLRARGTETEESLAKRLGAAAEEME